MNIKVSQERYSLAVKHLECCQKAYREASLAFEETGDLNFDFQNALDRFQAAFFSVKAAKRHLDYAKAQLDTGPKVL